LSQPGPPKGLAAAAIARGSRERDGQSRARARALHPRSGGDGDEKTALRKADAVIGVLGRLDREVATRRFLPRPRTDGGSSCFSSPACALTSRISCAYWRPTPPAKWGPAAEADIKAWSTVD
jgi:hypothetical protein